MSDDGQDPGDKQYEPTQKKLDDARKKGEVPRSTDLHVAASYAGLLLAGAALGGASLGAIAQALSAMLARPVLLSDLVFAGSGHPVSAALMADLVPPILPWMALPALMVVLSIIAQRSFTFTGTKLQPKLSRVSLISNAKNKFGRKGLFEFGKSAAKLVILGTILFLFLSARTDQIIAAAALDPRQVTVLLLRLSLQFLMLSLLVAGAIGVLDFLFQKAEHLRQNRMSHKEMMDEVKASEGDPHTKQQRRQKGYDIATNRMLADVPEADVVIVNPTHYAVALKWDRMSPGAPQVVAKGVDEIAARIREAAIEAGVPIHSDPPTARALHATLDIGDEVVPEHYAAVAAAIRFAEAMRRKARQR